MNALAIFALIEKGITIAEILIKTGKSAAPAFEALKNLLTGARSETVSDDDIAKTEALLDSMLAEFNQEI